MLFLNDSMHYKNVSLIKKDNSCNYARKVVAVAAISCNEWGGRKHRRRNYTLAQEKIMRNVREAHITSAKREVPCGRGPGPA